MLWAGNEQAVPGRKSHSSAPELLVRCFRKMARLSIPRGVLTALRAAAQEEQGLSPGTLLLEQPLGFVTVICCKAVPCGGYPDHLLRT